MKIILLNTPTCLYPKTGRVEKYNTIPPYGLGYIAISLSNVIGKNNIKLIDAEYLGLSPKRATQMILENKPDFIGINCHSPNFYIMKLIIKKLAGEHINKHSVIVGGTHAILFPEQILKDKHIGKYIAFVATGEGEKPLTEFVSGIKKEDIKGISFSKGNEIISTPPNNLNNEELNKLIIDRTFFDNDPNEWNDGKTKESYIMSSRGCSYRCSFCAARLISKGRIRIRSNESILEELKLLIDSGVNYVRFLDDLLFVSKKRIKYLFNIFNSLGLNYTNFGFEANARVNILSTLEKKEWDNLKLIGLKEIEIGIESGSQRVLDIMKKRTTPNQIVKTVTEAAKRGIKIKGFLMVGFISETNADLQKTIELVKELKKIAGSLIRFSPVPAKVYPGTKLRDDLKFNIDNTYDTVLDLSKEFNINEQSEIYKILKDRTRYNAIHTYNGKPIALSEMTNGASTKTVIKALAELILISSEKMLKSTSV